jgi:hypothetical protein
LVVCRVRSVGMLVPKYQHKIQERTYPARWAFPEDSWAAKQAEIKRKKDRLEMMLEMKRLKEL